MIDPKPNLSRAAIESNIEYYTSIRDRYAQAMASAEQDRALWQARLEQLEQTL